MVPTSEIETSMYWDFNVVKIVDTIYLYFNKKRWIPTYHVILIVLYSYQRLVQNLYKICKYV